MGGACCVAAKDKSIVAPSRSEVVTRNARHSPTWSFRWENRGRVAGEETSISWFSNGRSRNGRSDFKYESNCTSEFGSPSESLSRQILQKSPMSEVSQVHETPSTTDKAFSRNTSMDAISDNVKDVEDSTNSQRPSKHSPSMLSSSPLSASPLSFHNPPNPPTPRWHPLSGKGSDIRLQEYRPPSSCSVTCGKPYIPLWRTDSARGSCGGSSDGWSVNTIPELLLASQRDSFSLENEFMNTTYDDSRCDDRVSPSSSVSLQACGICKKLVSEKITFNDLSVVAVLVCGHVYHADCLEILTPEANKYDPGCPICTFGERQTLLLSQKAMNAEMEIKSRNKRLKTRRADGDLDGFPLMFDDSKGSGRESTCPGLASSSSMKGSSSKPFLRKHFSIGFKSQSSKKKGFFWSRSLKA